MEKQKRHHQYLSSQAIVILWALIQSFGWAIIYLLVTNTNALRLDPLMLVLVGLFSGSCMGALQHTLINRGVGIRLLYWLPLTAFGSAIGLGSLAFMYWVGESPYLFFLPVFLAPSILQWVSIRHHTRSGWLWIVANTIAGTIFVMFMLLITDQGQDFLSAVIPALLQGIASGFVMVWLLRKLPKQADAQKGQLADA